MSAPDPHGSPDRGTTLPELLVSIVLFGVIAAAVSVTIIATMRLSRGTDERVQNLSGAQVAVDDMSKLIQTAAQLPVAAGDTPSPAITEATASDLHFYGYNDPGKPPSDIEFWVNNGDLLETITPVTGSGASGCLPPYALDQTDKRTRVLAEGLGDSPEIFSYATQPSTGGVVGGSTLAMAGSPPALSSDDLGDVELVTIALDVNDDPNPGVGSTVASTTVALPNHLVSVDNLRNSAC